MWPSCVRLRCTTFLLPARLDGAGAESLGVQVQGQFKHARGGGKGRQERPLALSGCRHTSAYEWGRGRVMLLDKPLSTQEPAYVVYQANSPTPREENQALPQIVLKRRAYLGERLAARTHGSARGWALRGSGGRADRGRWDEEGRISGLGAMGQATRAAFCGHSHNRTREAGVVV